MGGRFRVVQLFFAHVAAKQHGVKVIIGTELQIEDGPKLESALLVVAAVRPFAEPIRIPFRTWASLGWLCGFLRYFARSQRACPVISDRASRSR